MKVLEIKPIISNAELLTQLCGNNKKMKRSVFRENLAALSLEQQNRVCEFIEKASENHPRNSYVLIKCFSQVLDGKSEVSDEEQKLRDKVNSLVMSMKSDGCKRANLPERGLKSLGREMRGFYREKIRPLAKEVSGKASHELDKLLIKQAVQAEQEQVANDFSQYICPVEDLEEKALELQKDGHKEAKRVLDSVKVAAEHDPTIATFTYEDARLPQFMQIASRSNPPYDFNRAGRDQKNVKGEKTVFLNASDVIVEGQRFVLTGCPMNKQQAAWLWEELIRQNVQVAVSLHNIGEATSRCPSFWHDDVLKDLPWTGERKVDNVSSRILIEGENGAKIVETKLQATNGHENREMTHLHYVGWKDRKAIPDEKLYQTLLDRMRELSPSGNVPISINCRGGVGRTGTTAAAYALERPGQKAVNIPQTIFDLRKQRKGMVGQNTQFSQIYSVLGRYFNVS